MTSDEWKIYQEGQKDGKVQVINEVLKAIQMCGYATAVPKVGYWAQADKTLEVRELTGCKMDEDIWRCSECGDLERVKSGYCPRCGTKMVG